MQSNHEQYCPLCGQANHCSQAKDPAAKCWCFSQTVPEALIQQAGDKSRCICQACIQHYQQHNKNAQE